MKINSFIILLIGKSGTGKTTVQGILQKKYNLKPLISYTTRPPRYKDEFGHIFVDDENFDKLIPHMCAYTEFNGFRYCATQQQVDEADVYIIDPAGVDYFMNQYHGKKKIITVELLAHQDVRFKRMVDRGDGKWNAASRIRHDRKAFAKTNPMITINANIENPEEIAQNVMNAVTMYNAVGEINNE